MVDVCKPVEHTIEDKWEQYWSQGQYNVSFPYDSIVSYIMRTCKNSRKILDVGCGNGNNFSPIQSVGAIPVGIDCSKTALAIAKKRFPQSELFNTSFNEIWPIESESIDHAFDRASLTCGRKDMIISALSQVYRVLKKGGTFKWVILSDDSDFCRLGSMDRAGFVESSTASDVPTGDSFRGYTFLSYKDINYYLSNFKVIEIVKASYEKFNENGQRRKQCFYHVLASKV